MMWCHVIESSPGSLHGNILGSSMPRRSAYALNNETVVCHCESKADEATRSPRSAASCDDVDAEVRCEMRSFEV